MEFGATYPYEDTTPYAYGRDNFRYFRGSHGVELRTIPKNKLFDSLPSYARTKKRRFPNWKIQFIRQNREFYAAHRKMIDKWLPQILEFPSSFQKFEWNCKGAKRDLWKLIIQFRASGVRVKRPTTAPSLVAMTTTQVPIIGWQKRYMMPIECARLQSMHELKYLPDAAGPRFRSARERRQR
jgi:DNA (cytosine-5)-methyltransferase 1